MSSIASTIATHEVDSFDPNTVDTIMTYAMNSQAKVAFDCYDHDGNQFSQDFARLYMDTNNNNTVYIGDHQYYNTYRYVRIRVQGASDCQIYVLKNSGNALEIFQAKMTSGTLQIGEKVELIVRNQNASLQNEAHTLQNISHIMGEQTEDRARATAIKNSIDNLWSEVQSLKNNSGTFEKNLWGVMNGAISKNDIGQFVNQVEQEVRASNRSIQDTIQQQGRSLNETVSTSARVTQDSINNFSEAIKRQGSVLDTLRTEVAGYRSDMHRERSQTPVFQSPNTSEVQLLSQRVSEVLNRSQSPNYHSGEIQTISQRVSEIHQRVSTAANERMLVEETLRSIRKESKIYPQSAEIQTILSLVRDLTNRPAPSFNVELQNIQAMLRDLGHRQNNNQQQEVYHAQNDLQSIQAALRDLTGRVTASQNQFTALTSDGILRNTSLPSDVQNLLSLVRELVSRQQTTVYNPQHDIQRLTTMIQETNARISALGEVQARAFSPTVIPPSTIHTTVQSAPTNFVYDSASDTYRSRLEKYGLTETARLNSIPSVVEQHGVMSSDDLKLFPYETHSTWGERTFSGVGNPGALTDLPNYGWPKNPGINQFFDTLYRNLLTESRLRSNGPSAWYAGVQNRKNKEDAKVSPVLASMFEIMAFAPASKEQLAFILELALVIKGEMTQEEWNLMILARTIPSTLSKLVLEKYLKGGTPAGGWKLGGVKPTGLPLN